MYKSYFKLAHAPKYLRAAVLLASIYHIILQVQLIGGRWCTACDEGRWGEGMSKRTKLEMSQRLVESLAAPARYLHVLILNLKYSVMKHFKTQLNSTQLCLFSSLLSVTLK